MSKHYIILVWLNRLTGTERRVTWPGAIGLTHCLGTSSEVVAWGTTVHGSVHKVSALRCGNITIGWSLEITTIHGYIGQFMQCNGYIDNHSQSHDVADPDHCPLAVQVRLASPFSVYPSLQEYTAGWSKVVPCTITTLPFVGSSSAPQSTTVQWKCCIKKKLNCIYTFTSWLYRTPHSTC